MQHPAAPRSPSAARLVRLPAALCAALCAALVASCGEHTVAPSGPELAPDVEVVAARDTAIMRVRSTRQLAAMVKNPVGRDLPNKRHTTWRSDDARVAAIDGAGLVTALDTGRARLIVEHKGSADTVALTVILVPVDRVTIAPAVDTAFLGDTAFLDATTLDSAGGVLTGRALAWTTSDEAVAAVEGARATEHGAGYRALVVARALGEATLTATAANTVEGYVYSTRSGTARVVVLRQPVHSVAIQPDEPSVEVDRAVQLTATLRDRHGTVLADRAVTWASLDPAKASVTAAGLVSALDTSAAPARIVAASEERADTVALRITNPVEARVLWVNRFEYGPNPARIAQIMQRAKDANFNAVYFQVRGQGDAYYYSQLEPCAVSICGALGRGFAAWDPLAVAVSEAHARGLQLHAWINVLTGFSSPVDNNASFCQNLRPSTSGAPNHLLIDHPEWAAVSSAGMVMSCTTSQAFEYAYVSPGIPAVRAHVARVAADIVRRYDVDGVHLDRIRYPGQFHSSDAPSLAEFRARYHRNPTSSTTDAQWVAFRREQVNLTVRGIRDSIDAVRPVVLSAAVWGIFTDNWQWNTGGGFTSYWQDPRTWADSGWLDVANPMTYPASAASTSYTIKSGCLRTSTADWGCLLDDHKAAYAQRGRHMYIGVGAIKGATEVRKQIEMGRQRGVTGFAVYSVGQMDSRALWDMFRTELFRRPATIPPMPWRTSGLLAAPAMRRTGTSLGALLSGGTRELIEEPTAPNEQGEEPNVGPNGEP